MSTQTIQFSVKNGPSIDRVMDSFKYACSKGEQLNVTFQGSATKGNVKYSTKIVGIVTAIEYESGAPGMFNLGLIVPGYVSVKGFYNANSRLGGFTMQMS